MIGLEPRPPAGATRSPRNPTLAPKVRYRVGSTDYLYTAAHGLYRQRHRVGETIEVLYDPANPAEARLRGEGEVMLPLITAGFATAAVLVGFVLIRTRRLGRTPDAADAPDDQPNHQPAALPSAAGGGADRR